MAELAAGLIGDSQSEELLRHAASCDHCGPLLRQSIEDFDEDVTPAETEFLAALKSATPELQERLATRLVRATRAGGPGLSVGSAGAHFPRFPSQLGLTPAAPHWSRCSCS